MWNENVVESFFSISNVESSFVSSAMAFRMRELYDAARENLVSAHFLSL